MQAESVLIDRIPGKSTVGIQIPNRNREQISLRELLESDAYTRSQSKLTLALGKTIHGEPFVSDLATMPHLLIAGSTGTGKSVGQRDAHEHPLPRDARRRAADHDRPEAPRAGDVRGHPAPADAGRRRSEARGQRPALGGARDGGALQDARGAGVRNIEQYNRNVRRCSAGEASSPNDDDGEPLKPLPFIVVVIDELADLMMVASNEVEESICRLAQMARAVGIHLILATQRPSVDVITGLIKANLPARISFRVSSKIDSRTILDGNGAEQLLGKGDMLYLPPASSRFVRLHGPTSPSRRARGSPASCASRASRLRRRRSPRTRRRPAETSSSRRTTCTTKPRASSSRAGRRRSRTCSGAADRLQPRGAAGGHDGSRRARSRLVRPPASGHSLRHRNRPSSRTSSALCSPIASV
jgi:DNA segregation ATPase FtsK/SpoIIIE, S-DNA-T family